MNSLKLTRLALLGAVALLGSAAYAAQEPVKADPYKSEPVKSEPVRSDQSTPMTAQSNAQLDKGTMSLKFDELDKNKDGFITKDEVPATLELSTSFVNFDDNADGKLSKDEYAKYKPMKDESKAKVQKY